MMFQTAFHWVALVGVLAVPVAAQPPNDSCSSAEMLTLQSDGTARVTGTTIGASLDGPAFCGVSNTSPGVWYKFEKTGPAQITASTCNDGSDFDTKISIFRGDPDCGDLICLGGRDDTFDCDLRTILSDVEGGAFGANTYYILVHGFGEEVGNFQLDVLVEPLDEIPCGPIQDLGRLANNEKSATILGNNEGAPITDVPNCGGAAASNTKPVWFEIDVDCVTMLTVSTCFDETNFDTQITILEGFPGGCVDGNGQFFCVDAQDDTGGCLLQTILDVPREGEFGPPVSKTYYILVHGFGDAAGDFKLEVTAETVGTGTCHGDPHFMRWGHKKRDSFHGECDLVFVHADELATGDTLDVHVRTTMMEHLSYVESAAVGIGDDILEFHADGFLFNGLHESYNTLPLTFGSQGQYKVIHVENEKKKKKEYRVMLGLENYISVWATGKIMSISATGTASNFGSSVGMLGQHGTGNMIGRNGEVFDDYIEYGFEWQVRPEDPQLFVFAREPQLPYEKCRMPGSEMSVNRRKLRANGDRKLLEAATAACDGSIDFDLCVDDVVVSGELGLAVDFF